MNEILEDKDFEKEIEKEAETIKKFIDTIKGKFGVNFISTLTKLDTELLRDSLIKARENL